ncbi:MAG: DUF1517 domain-containing protein [Synechococcus sp. SB0678_bin_12]|nr:DUF1517 domain-containing protein [Synechococcus sp. SB0678_bin_12]MYI87318.1 DUF1517 domain-containing protein [Synechococcus sp. SB0672_bin_10]
MASLFPSGPVQRQPPWSTAHGDWRGDPRPGQGPEQGSGDVSGPHQDKVRPNSPVHHHRPPASTAGRHPGPAAQPRGLGGSQRGGGQVGFPVAEAAFNRLSMTERSKLDGETTINVAGQRRRGEAGQHSTASEYIVVTLLVASRSSIRLPKLTTADDLPTALRLLGSIPSGD